MSLEQKIRGWMHWQFSHCLDDVTLNIPYFVNNGNCLQLCQEVNVTSYLINEEDRRQPINEYLEH